MWLGEHDVVDVCERVDEAHVMCCDVLDVHWTDARGTACFVSLGLFDCLEDFFDRDWIEGLLDDRLSWDLVLNGQRIWVFLLEDFHFFFLGQWVKAADIVIQIGNVNKGFTDCIQLEIAVHFFPAIFATKLDIIEFWRFFGFWSEEFPQKIVECNDWILFILLDIDVEVFDLLFYNFLVLRDAKPV